MKIDKSIKTLGAMQATEARQRATRDAAVDTTSADSAKVDLSPRSAQIKQIASHAQAPVDRSKVEQLKQAISECKFKVNPEKIADSLISDVQQMLANNRQA